MEVTATKKVLTSTFMQTVKISHSASQTSITLSKSFHTKKTIFGPAHRYGTKRRKKKNTSSPPFLDTPCSVPMTSQFVHSQHVNPSPSAQNKTPALVF